MQGYKKPSKCGASSIATLDEHDCGERRVRFMSLAAYAGRMGRGGVLGVIEKSGPWRQIPPQTVNAGMVAHPCR